MFIAPVAAPLQAMCVMAVVVAIVAGCDTCMPDIVLVQP
ncbi:hypothetical protein NU08_4346 [Flavobacterium anhuiense]|uniref:Uncharacterized protein n=1 Tax=Flavobacterium anhuiense TaxID=459526 RepID=A0A444VSQ9_9FLAO|nr:hypothetical protein NU08_4346 [Flavobacterium anhuiense]